MPKESDTVEGAIVAAGAIVRGVGSNAGKILVVRRKRYGAEVSLPKGKLQEGESEIVAAQREVLEETGRKGTIRGYAGSTHYLANGAPKAVFYFIMDTVDVGVSRPGDTAEISAAEWLGISEAIQVLTHAEDRDLVAAVFGIKRNL